MVQILVANNLIELIELFLSVVARNVILEFRGNRFWTRNLELLCKVMFRSKLQKSLKQMVFPQNPDNLEALLTTVQVHLGVKITKFRIR